MEILQLVAPTIINFALNCVSFANSLMLNNRIKNISMEDLTLLSLTIDNNITVLRNTSKEVSYNKRGHVFGLIKNFEELSTSLKSLGPMVEKVRTFAFMYDLPGASPANGYRTFVHIADKTAATVYDTVQECFKQFSSPGYVNKVSELNSLVRSLYECFTYLLKLHSLSVDGCLFPSQPVHIKEVFNLLEKVDQKAFYGSFIAFQFEEKIRFVLARISLFMVSYSELYYGNSIIRTGFRFLRYMLSNTTRASRHVALIQNAGVDFIQSFWSFSESPVMIVPMKVLNPVAVSEEIWFNLNAVTVNRVEVKPDYEGSPMVRGQLISKHVRQGMTMAGRGAREKSRGLVIHVHGGGFVSQSARTQEIFLRKWAATLDVPVFAIDYSLAPSWPYPRAVQEVWYSYCVALAQAARLGSTAERVVCAGDSAGANLVLALVQECITRGVRVPDGLMLAYVPVLLTCVPSPARLLGVLDPLLPFGVMMRCARAYVQGESTKTSLPPISTCSCIQCQKTSQWTFLDNPHLEFNPESFLLEFPMDPYISPYEAPDAVLAKMPPIALSTSTLDPCLDDTIMFAKKLQQLGNQVRLDIVHELPHGFLNFCWVSEEAARATRQCGQRISELLNLAPLP